jgi:hypothetical protein
VISALSYLLAVAWPATGVLLLFKLAAISALILAAYLSAGEFGTDRVAFLSSLVWFKRQVEGQMQE